MNVPVVATARLERHVSKRNLFGRNAGEITITDKIPRICRVRFTDGKNHFTLECSFSIVTGRIFRPYVFSKTEGRPRFRPSGIEANVSDDFGNFSTGNTVILRRLEMKCQRTVRDTLTDERGNRNQTTVAKTKFVGPAPYLTEKNIVVKFREFRSELTELITPSRLYYLFLCHNIKC